MNFKHPLARDAKVWTTAGLKGEARKILVVITTLELDPGHRKFKAEKSKTLSDAAREWIAQNAADVSDVLLVNRPKDWNGNTE